MHRKIQNGTSRKRCHARPDSLLMTNPCFAGPSLRAAVTMTGRDGRVSKLEQVYLRGSHIKLIVLPDVLKNAPVFKPVQKMKKKDDESGGGRGGGFKKPKKPKA